MERDGQNILVSQNNGVLEVTINRPELRNAVSTDMPAKLTTIFQNAQNDSNVRCLLITGAGDHFSAGGDIAGFQQTLTLPVEERQIEFRQRMGRVSKMVEAFLDFDRPIVARCVGSVAGVALGLVLAADMVLASQTAMFFFAHQRMALVPDAGVTWLLPRLIGLRNAKRLLLTAAKVDSAEALHLGLVTSVHPTNELDAAVAKVVGALVCAPQEAVKRTKKLLNDSLSSSIPQQLAAERENIVQCVGQEDFSEAIQAFMAKRPPNFSPR
jgi:2-(1,2-epoxy-1,2-dihydrophenyl)acetyl-CoA isomerase